MDENVEHVRRLIRQFGRNVALVVNHSGGKDSTRMIGLVRGIFPTLHHIRRDGRHRI